MIQSLNINDFITLAGVIAQPKTEFNFGDFTSSLCVAAYFISSLVITFHFWNEFEKRLNKEDRKSLDYLRNSRAQVWVGFTMSSIPASILYPLYALSQKFLGVNQLTTVILLLLVILYIPLDAYIYLSTVKRLNYTFDKNGKPHFGKFISPLTLIYISIFIELFILMKILGLL